MSLSEAFGLKKKSEEKIFIEKKQRKEPCLNSAGRSLAKLLVILIASSF